MAQPNPVKFRPPSLRRPIVVRHKIMKLLLDGQAQGRNLTLVCAPAGYGKTTLVRSWLEEVGQPLAWVSLDEEDAYPQRFLSSLVSALQSVIFGIGEGIRQALRGAGSHDCHGEMEALLDELSMVDAPFVLVLDDFHLASSTETNSLLELLVKNQPPLLQLVMTTRNVPNLPLAVLRVRNRLTQVGAEDLGFSEEEAGDFLNSVMGMNLPPSAIAHLEERTEGWAAALQLAALSLKSGRDPQTLFQSFSGTQTAVAEYLTEAVLITLPGLLQKQLLQASLVEPFCGVLWDAMGIGNGQGDGLIRDLVQQNLFLVPLDQEGKWFRFHTLFSDLLRHRSVREVPPMEARNLRLAASSWYESQGLVEPAFRQAMAAKEFTRAADLAEDFWDSMERELNTATWLRWVREIPESERRGRAMLLAQMGWSYMDASLTDESEACLKASEEAMESQQPKRKVNPKRSLSTLPGRIAFTRAYNALVSGQEDLAEDLTLLALEKIPLGEVLLKAQAASLLFGIHWSRGNFSLAAKTLGDFSQATKEAENPVFALMGLSYQGDALRTQGKLRGAEDTYRRVLREAEAGSLESFTPNAHLGLGLIALERGDTESPHLEKAFLLGDANPQTDWSFRKALAQAVLCESLGELDKALFYLEEARRTFVSTPVPVLRPLEALRTQMQWNHGHTREARYWADSLSLSWGIAPPFKEEFAWLLRFRILSSIPESRVYKDRLAAGEPVLRGILQKSREQERFASLVEAGVTSAIYRKSLGDWDGAVEALQEPLVLAEREGLVRTLTLGPESFRNLLTEARGAGRVLGSLPDAGNSRFLRGASVRYLLEPLSKREKEVLNLIAQGLSNEDIGEKLFVSLSTVKGHNLRIFEKLQAKNRTEAVAKARDAGILENHP